MGRLQDQMKTDLLLKRYSPHTTRAYLRCIRDFAKHFMRSPAEMGEAEGRQFLLYLTQERKITSGLQTTDVSALKFLYRITLRQPGVVEHLPYPKRPKTFPVVRYGKKSIHDPIEELFRSKNFHCSSADFVIDY